MRIDENKFIFDKFSFSDLLYADFCDRKSLYEHMLNMKQYVNGKVLDFGCGKKPYVSLFEFKEYIGIDTEDSGHGWIDKSGPDIFYDGCNMPFNDDEFDAVLSTQVFEHIPDMELSIEEITRVLKRGGYLIVTVPMAEEEHEIPYDFRRFTEIGLRSFLVNHGYEIIESGKINTWKNSMRILNIGRLCHDNRNDIFNKILKYLYILHCNLHRITFGNHPKEGSLFSNKVYCTARLK